MDSQVPTPRLLLTRLTDTTPDSQHVTWFHELWSDEGISSWSLHGRCNTLSESQDWLTQKLTKMDEYLYAVHVRTAPAQSLDHGQEGESAERICKKENKEMLLIGSIGLRVQASSPLLPLAPHPTASPDDAAKADLRAIGYAFFESAWGKGYATEACRALLEAYADFRVRENPGALSYVEAGVDPDNPDSIKVLEKLGFKKVGWIEEEESVFIGGKWRDAGYWIYGLYV